jgi:FdhD protein
MDEVERAFAVAETAGRPAERVRIVRVRDGVSEVVSDAVASEEPLEVRLNGEQVAVTMRTPAPGEDIELAVGFLLGEGILAGHDQIARVVECRTGDAEGGAVDVRLRPDETPVAGWQRNFYVTSSCGICGKASLDAVRVAADPIAAGPEISAGVIAELPARLRDSQQVFDRTGGLHAAGLFTPAGELLVLREDVGRHNAVDKAVGRAAMDGLQLSGSILQVSGRASFEIVQKAAMAGIPVVAAVSAPSSLAVALASELGMTLIGFSRPGGFNLYAGAERVADAG